MSIEDELRRDMKDIPPEFARVANKNMKKLLWKGSPSGQELREKIQQIQFDCWSDSGKHSPEISSCQECLNQLMQLSHHYAQSYAESIIGQDEPGVTNVMIAMEHNHQRALNNERGGKLT